MTSRPLRDRDFERILLIKPSAVGDVIHTVPVLAKLRARYPSARIDWLLNPGIAELVRHHPGVSNIVPFERALFAGAWRSWSALKGLSRLLASLSRARYDLVIDLHGQFRSAILTMATGSAVRVGFDRPRRGLERGPRDLPRSAYVHGWTGAREGSWAAYTHRIQLQTLEMHAVDRYLLLGSMLGLPEGPADFSIPLPAAAGESVGRLLSASGLAGKPYAVLVPGTLWETKHWHVDGFSGVGRHLRARGYGVVLAGSAKETGRCQAVAAACPGAVDLSGKTALTELAALIARAAVCVTNDSGSMHLTVAMNRPVVSIFGPTDPVWIGPYGRAGAVEQAGTACSPCYLRALRRCPHDHACMRDVTDRHVIDRVERVLADWTQAARAG